MGDIYKQANDLKENVNHPSHYNMHPSGIECIDIVKFHDFCIGNAIKYIWRCGLKGKHTGIEDLKKAIFYLEKKIEMMERDM